MSAHICTADNAISQIMVQVEYQPNASARRVVVTSHGNDAYLAVEYVTLDSDGEIDSVITAGTVRLDVESAVTLGRYLVGLGERS